MTDENLDLRLLAERLERNHAETTTNIARLETRVEAIPAAMDRYVRADVYEAREKARDVADASRDAAIKRLEDGEKTDRATGRSWVQGIALILAGSLCGFIAQLLTARGGH